MSVLSPKLIYNEISPGVEGRLLVFGGKLFSETSAAALLSDKYAVHAIPTVETNGCNSLALASFQTPVLLIAQLMNDLYKTKQNKTNTAIFTQACFA